MSVRGYGEVMGMKRSRDNKSMSRFMQNQAKKDKAWKEKHQPQATEETAEPVPEPPREPSVPLGKTTRLVFFKQYNTYQALLSIYPRGTLTAKDVFSKVILYIMRWFRDRLRDEAFAAYPEIAFLREDYPEPENYADFDIEQVANINGLDFLDFETAYLPDRNAWVLGLTEPDNGQEGKDLQGRTFTTEIFVYKQEDSVALGIKEGCREPRTNEEDALGFRPAFVRIMFFDDDMMVGEYGVDKAYAFAHNAHRLNGKSSEACRKLYDGLVGSPYRQMPVLFVPGEYYENNTEEVDKKAESLLGYCHIVVWESTCRKLFEQVMVNNEYLEAAENGQLIFHRSTCQQDFPADYFEPGVEDLMEVIKAKAQKEPLRKYCDFRDFIFKPSWWESMQALKEAKPEDIEEVKQHYEARISHIQREANDFKRDNESLQHRINSLDDKIRNQDKTLTKTFSDMEKCLAQLNETMSERDQVKDELQQTAEKVKQNADRINIILGDEKTRYRPLINLPPFGLENKGEILAWIRKYYSDLLEIHPSAEDSFYSDNKNIDWHRFCMMIHYLAGYTRYRNEGGKVIDATAAREYDPENSGYKVEPSSSGQGSTEMHREKYTIAITEDGILKQVLLDIHLKYGKGNDNNMIRIYFYYSPAEKKSFIGYMPGHLPTRKSSH